MNPERPGSGWGGSVSPTTRTRPSTAGRTVPARPLPMLPPSEHPTSPALLSGVEANFSPPTERHTKAPLCASAPTLGAFRKASPAASTIGTSSPIITSRSAHSKSIDPPISPRHYHLGATFSSQLPPALPPALPPPLSAQEESALRHEFFGSSPNAAEGEPRSKLSLLKAKLQKEVHSPPACTGDRGGA
jgi:hypothetical protein